MGIVELSRQDLPAIRRLLETACAYDEAGKVAEEKLFNEGASGAEVGVLGLWSDDQLVGVAGGCGQWLRLVAVAPAARDQGIGGRLIEAIEKRLAAQGARQIITLAEPGNYLAPGIDARNIDTIQWFGRRGYQRHAENSNLLISLRDNPRVTRCHALKLVRDCQTRGFIIARVDDDDPGIADFVGHHFHEAWAVETRRALAQPLGAVYAATIASSHELVGFAVHDGNNSGLGWFGPAGTLPEYRGHGVGAALLVACLADIHERDLDWATIAWIGPRAFYERSVGVHSERKFVVMKKSLITTSADED